MTNWMLVGEAAAALGFSERTLWRKIERGEVRARKRGGRTLVAIEYEPEKSATDMSDMSDASLGRPARQGPQGFDPARHARQQLEAARSELEIRQIKAAHQELDEREGARRQRREQTRAEEERRKVEERRRGEAERARQQRAEAERREKQELAARRREILQDIKRTVVEYGTVYGIPSELKGQALRAVEQELAPLALEEIPRHELITMATAVRDRVYAPHRQAEREAAERARQQRDKAFADTMKGVAESLATANRQEELVAHGKSYATRELLSVKDLEPLESWSIQRKVEERLRRDITGKETMREVEDLVEEVLADEGIE